MDSKHELRQTEDILVVEDMETTKQTRDGKKEALTSSYGVHEEDWALRIQENSSFSSAVKPYSAAKKLIPVKQNIQGSLLDLRKSNSLRKVSKIPGDEEDK